MLKNGSVVKTVLDAIIFSKHETISMFMESPLQGISSLSQLLELPYFDFLACMGEFPLHVGASKTTQEVINAAKVRIGERVLEVGCGTGWTTQALIRSGAKVTVVEKSPRMLASTLRNCRRSGLPMPKNFLGAAEDLSCLTEASFDFALYECVLGFVEDKHKAVSECKRVLSPVTSRIGVVDFHYVSPPTPELTQRLKETFLTPVVPLSEEEWKDVFADFKPIYWKTHDVPGMLPPTTEQIKKSLSQSDLLNELPEVNNSVFEAFSRRWAEWEILFAENRKILRCHVAAWKVQ